MSGSGISWAICKSAPSSRQTTTPAPHHSVAHRCPKSPPMFTLPDHAVQFGVTTPAAMLPVTKLLWTLVVQTVLFIYCVVYVIAVLGRGRPSTTAETEQRLGYHVTKHSIITKTCISCRRCTRATESCDRHSLMITVIN